MTAVQMLGMHGTVAANFAVDRADLLLAIGVRFDDRVTGKLESFAARARIVHVDIDPAEINKNKASHVTVCADAKPSLKVGDCIWRLWVDFPSCSSSEDSSCGVWQSCLFLLLVVVLGPCRSPISMKSAQSPLKVGSSSWGFFFFPKSWMLERMLPAFHLGLLWRGNHGYAVCLR